MEDDPKNSKLKTTPPPQRKTTKKIKMEDDQNKFKM